MNILVVDTATELLEVMVSTCDGRLFGTQMRAGLRHAELLMPTVHRTLESACLRVSELDLIVCSKGPGSFTGLRIGMASAKGLAMPYGTALVGVPSLDAMAYALRAAKTAVVPVIDAKKGRVYAALYHEGERRTGYLDVSPEELRKLIEPYPEIILTGPDHSMVFPPATSESPAARYSVYPAAGYGVGPAYIELGRMLLQAQGPDRPDEGPLYVRRSDAEISLGKDPTDG